MASFNALARVAMASAGRASAPPTRRVVSTARARRFSSSEAEAAKPSPTPSTPPPPPPPPPPPAAAKSGGSSLLQRIGAFLTGAGLGCGVGYYHLGAEIKGSTAALEKAIAKNHSDLNDRLAKLEKK